MRSPSERREINRLFNVVEKQLQDVLPAVLQVRSRSAQLNGPGVI